MLRNLLPCILTHDLPSQNGCGAKIRKNEKSSDSFGESNRLRENELSENGSSK